MHLPSECLNALKYPAFWENTENPFLIKFLEFRSREGDIKDETVEHRQYKSELNTILRFHTETSEIGQESDKNSYPINLFWDMQTKRQNIHIESKILEETSQLQQNELRNQIRLERTRQILDATKDIRNQDHLLRETITKQIKEDLNELHVKNLESVTVGQKRPYEEEVPPTPPDKIRAVTFDDEESTIPIESSFIPTIPVESSTSLIDTQNDDVFDKKVSREAYIKIRQDVRDRPSQKDWFIGECNVSNAFRNFQITNIDKLESGVTFFFSLNIEEILSLHHIMLVDLTKMKKPSYVVTDERSWRASVRQPSQPDPVEFFGNIMNEYEKVINDIDELRLKFYKMWGKYCDKVIYSDEERRLFETTQIVARVFYERMHMFPDSGKDENEDTVMHEYIHDTFKETFRDSNYDAVWANSQSLSSKDYRSTYGRSQGKKTDLTIYRIIEKGEREESCFVEAKPFSVTRTSKVGGYNLYKVAIFCQGGINKILLCENEPGVQTFGGHICEGYIYFCMMDLEYDGIYRFFQLSEIKLAQKLSEFNLVRKLILETYFFKCRIDSYYSNRNNHNCSFQQSSFMRNPAVTPRAPRNAIPDVSLSLNKGKRQKPKNKRNA